MVITKVSLPCLERNQVASNVPGEYAMEVVPARRSGPCFLAALGEVACETQRDTARCLLPGSKRLEQEIKSRLAVPSFVGTSSNGGLNFTSKQRTVAILLSQSLPPPVCSANRGQRLLGWPACRSEE